MFAEVYVVRAAPSVTPLQVAGHHHGEQKRADTSMVRLVELARLEEALEDEEHGPQLRVLLQQLLDELDTVDAILTVEADVDVDGSLFVPELDDGHFSVLNWLNRRANIRSHQLRGDSIDHGQLPDRGIVDQQVDIRLG